jgi:hexokinase
LIHEFSLTPLVPEGEAFQVLKVGGSIGQNALVVRRGQTIEIKAMEEERLPLFSTGKAFLAYVKAHLRKNINYLAINFAYPLRPVWENDRLDGIMTIGTKEHAFIGLIGRQVGVSVEKFIYEKFHREVAVAVANDTICLTLSGLTRYPTESVCGGIVGTGMNFAFFLNERQLVNLEAACFDKFTQSEAGKQIDKHSVQRGNSLFEKEVSGAYLYQHYNFLTKENLTSTHELDMVARGEKPGNQAQARALFNRAARLIACQIAGIALFKKRPMNFVMEGSLFWIGWNFRKTVAETVKLLAPAYPVSFGAIKNCGIIGAAKLAG